MIGYKLENGDVVVSDVVLDGRRPVQADPLGFPIRDLSEPLARATTRPWMHMEIGRAPVGPYE